jgi:hypothetical protein
VCAIWSSQEWQRWTAPATMPWTDSPDQKLAHLLAAGNYDAGASRPKNGLVAAASGVAYPQPNPPGPGGRRITFASYNRIRETRMIQNVEEFDPESSRQPSLNLKRLTTEGPCCSSPTRERYSGRSCRTCRRRAESCPSSLSYSSPSIARLGRVSPPAGHLPI